MEREQKKKEVEKRKLKRAVEKAEKERQKQFKKENEESTSKFEFSGEVHSPFCRRYENGYDLPEDTGLSEYHIRKMEKTIPS